MCLRFQFWTHHRVWVLHFQKKVKVVVPYCALWKNGDKTVVWPVTWWAGCWGWADQPALPSPRSYQSYATQQTIIRACIYLFPRFFAAQLRVVQYNNTISYNEQPKYLDFAWISSNKFFYTIIFIWNSQQTKLNFECTIIVYGLENSFKNLATMRRTKKM